MAAPNLSRDPLEPLPLLEGKHTDKTINDSLLEHVQHVGRSQAFSLFFHKTCVGQISHCSCSVNNLIRERPNSSTPGPPMSEMLWK